MSTIPLQYRELTQSVSENLATLRTGIPDVMKGFNDMARAATRDGALDRRTKVDYAVDLGVLALPAIAIDGVLEFPALPNVK